MKHFLGIVGIVAICVLFAHCEEATLSNIDSTDFKTEIKACKKLCESAGLNEFSVHTEYIDSTKMSYGCSCSGYVEMIDFSEGEQAEK